MSKRHKAATREAKRKRQQAKVDASRSFNFWPFGVVGVVAVAIAAVLFIGIGGSTDSSVEAAYPPGYEAPVLGDPGSPVELVMHGDYQCPFCRRFELQTLPQLKEEYVDSGVLHFVWRNFAHYGRESEDAATAAYCAGEQDKFWEYHDVLYENQGGVNSGAFSTPNLNRFAAELGLDETRFSTCLNKAGYDAVMAADYSLGRDAGVTGTPGFFVNGTFVSGAQPYETFAAMIEEAAQAAP